MAGYGTVRGRGWDGEGGERMARAQAREHSNFDGEVAGIGAGSVRGEFSRMPETDFLREAHPDVDGNPNWCRSS